MHPCRWAAELHHDEREWTWPGIFRWIFLVQTWSRGKSALGARVQVLLEYAVEFRLSNIGC